jgi:hypothetical protein
MEDATDRRGLADRKTQGLGSYAIQYAKGKDYGTTEQMECPVLRRDLMRAGEGGEMEFLESSWELRPP